VVGWLVGLVESSRIFTGINRDREETDHGNCQNFFLIFEPKNSLKPKNGGERKETDEPSDELQYVLERVSSHCGKEFQFASFGQYSLSRFFALPLVWWVTITHSSPSNAPIFFFFA
jgi:hypothetical protein